MKHRSAVLSLAALGFVLTSPIAAMAAPSGPEGPDNCTFDKGVTTCAQPDAPVVTESSSAPDSRTGCVTVTTTTTTTTTYTAHRGTYNSSGSAVTAPPPANSSSSTQSQECPVHGSVGLYAADRSGATCEGVGHTDADTQIGTVYFYESGPNVVLHVELTEATPNSPYYFAHTCVAFLHNGVTNSDGDDSFDTVLPNAAGTQVNFDYLDSAIYAQTGPVTL